MKTISPSEQKTLYRYLRGSAAPADTFLLLLFETGMRVGESITLTAGDLSPEGVLSIAPLKGSRPRSVGLSPGLAERLRGLPPGQWSLALARAAAPAPAGGAKPRPSGRGAKGPMSTLPLSEPTLASRKRVLCRHLHRLTLRLLGRRLNLHSLRHAAISRLYEATKDVVMTQQWAGQVSIGSTMVYVHQAKQREANDTHQNLLKSLTL